MAGLLDRPVVSPVMIGRGAQLALLHQVLARAKRGSGQTVLLAGEAGAGKTRLVAEARRWAADEGFRVLQGACFQADRASPYAPLLDMLRGHLSGQSAEAIGATLGRTAPILAPLLPDLLPRSSPDVPLERHQLSAAFSQLFLRRLADRPLLAVVEDLHWSDDSSLECLYHLARGCPERQVVLLLTYRSDEVEPRLQHWLARLDRQRLAEELALPNLTRGDVDTMLRGIFRLTRPVRGGFLDAICALTEGNPFFIEEVLTELVAAGDIFLGDGGWDRKPMGELRIPRSVQDAVQQRAERLSEPARDLLRRAAAIGRRFDYLLLQALTGQDESDLLGLLRELIGAGLIVEETVDQLAFRHALTREAIYADLLARERRALHGAIAQAIERQAAATLETRLSELAHHCYQAGLWGQASLYASRAGERAMAVYAPRAALELFRQALEAVQRLGQAAPPGWLRQRALAAEWLGDFDAARRDYEAALELAGAASDHQTEWQTLLDLGLLWFGRDYQRSRQYYQRALDLARTMNQPATLAHSLNRLGNWYANVDQPREGERLHQESLLLFEQLGDRRGVAGTRDLLGVAAYMRGDLDQLVEHYRRSVELLEALDDRRGLVASLATLAVGGGILLTGTAAPSLLSDAALEAGERALLLAREVGWRAGEAYTLAVLGSHLATLGEYGRALPLAQAALATAEEIEHRAWIAQAHLMLGGLYLDLLALPLAGQHLEQARTPAAELGSRYRLRAVVGLLAAVEVADGRPAAAEALLDSVQPPDQPPETLALRLCWWARAELALARAEPERALEIADDLIARAPGPGGLERLPRLALLRGRALGALGRPAEAETMLLAARLGADAQGARPVVWRSQGELGHLYLAWNRDAEAERHLEAARATVERLASRIADDGLRASFEREAAARLAGPRPAPAQRVARQQPDRLSAREREVCALIARGQTNGEIAEALCVSKRTVETHVGSIFAKLGFSRRAQVVAWAVAQEPAPAGEYRPARS